MKIMRFGLVLAAVFGCAAFGLVACQFHATSATWSTQSGPIKMVNPAMRPALGNNPDTAVYVMIENDGSEMEHLISASCSCAVSGSLHTMTMNGTMMTMAEQKGGFDIAPGQTLVFAPGGNHIMLEGLKTRPKDGDIITVNLTFSHVGTVPMITRVMTTPPGASK